MGEQERRASPRLARLAGLTVRELSFPVGGRDAVAVEMSDVSEGGLGFHSPVAYPVGTALEATLSLPGWYRRTQALDRFHDDDRPLTAVASVTRCLPLDGGKYDVGVRFTDIWDDHWRAMRRHMEDLLAEEAK